MFSSTAKMSVEASDVQSDEDCEELVEDGFCFSDDFLEKKTGRKRSSKTPRSQKSPYLASVNAKPRRTAVVAWKHQKTSLGDSRGGTPGDVGSSCFASLTNGFGVTFGTTEVRDSRDLYDEVVRLKKIIQAQKADSQLAQAKLRRMEEDNLKREKQIADLLDPTKRPEYTCGLVDKKKESSVVLYGLKQRILKLEQLFREKESALCKLQSELRTTNLDELKITADTYFEEIQRLKILLDAAEKSRADNKCSQRQYKAMSSTVVRLSENLTQLQQENASLREELNTESPAGGIRGYREWSKQRLLRRLLEVEKKLDDSRRHALSQKSRRRLDKEVQASTTKILDVTRRFTMATEAVVSVGTNTDEVEEVFVLSRRLGQLEKEGAELQKTLSKKDEEMKRLKTERDKVVEDTQQWRTRQSKEWERARQRHNEEMKLLKAERDKLEEMEQKTGQSNEWDRVRERYSEEMKSLKTERDKLQEEKEQWKTKQMKEWDRERQQYREEMKRLKTERDKLEEQIEQWKTKQMNEWDRERQRHKQEMEKLWERIQTLEEGRARTTQTQQPSPSRTVSGSHEEGLKGGQRGGQDLAIDAEKRGNRQDGEREKAATVIQKNWREHNNNDIVMLQSTFRGHLFRESQLKDPLEDKHNKAAKGTPCTEEASDAEGLSDVAAVTMVQSALRGHLTRTGQAVESSGLSEPSAVGERLSTQRRLRSPQTPSRTGQTELQCPTKSSAAGEDSDDSDIIVSPSRPSRRREVL